MTWNSSVRSTHHTMMSSSTDPSASSRRWVYCARPGAMRPRSLVRVRWRRSKASGPADPHRAQVADVEHHRPGAAGAVLGQGARRVGERHLPAAEGDHLGPQVPVGLVERRPAEHRRRVVPPPSVPVPRRTPVGTHARRAPTAAGRGREHAAPAGRVRVHRPVDHRAGCRRWPTGAHRARRDLAGRDHPHVHHRPAGPDHRHHDGPPGHGPAHLPGQRHPHLLRHRPDAGRARGAVGVPRPPHVLDVHRRARRPRSGAARGGRASRRWSSGAAARG